MKRLLFVPLVLLVACSSSPERRFDTADPEVHAAALDLTKLVRDNWHLPLRVRTSFPEGQGPRVRRQLAEVRSTYERATFDFYAVDVIVDEATTAPSSKLIARDGRIEIALPAKDDTVVA